MDAYLRRKYASAIKEIVQVRAWDKSDDAQLITCLSCSCTWRDLLLWSACLYAAVGGPAQTEH